MHRAIDPIGDSKNDYDVFTELSNRLGCWEAFTEGRDEEGWLRHLWDQARQQAGRAGFELPDFEAFCGYGPVELLKPDKPSILLSEFRGP